jgi:hypothetical protein
MLQGWVEGKYVRRKGRVSNSRSLTMHSFKEERGTVRRISKQGEEERKERRRVRRQI